jgi:Dolichyl-phosphate-mannose-protein mannosyltransferase
MPASILPTAPRVRNSRNFEWRCSGNPGAESLANRTGMDGTPPLDFHHLSDVVHSDPSRSDVVAQKGDRDKFTVALCAGNAGIWDKTQLGDRPSVMARGVTFAVFACALGWLMLFDPWAPFSREVGVCEAGAVRDVLAGNFILPSYDPQARFRLHQPGMPREREWGPGGMVQVPPLYWWLSALAARFLGRDEFALRLPSILAAAAVCALVYAWATVVFDRRIATWAAALVLLCKYFVENALSPRMDMLFVLFVAGACLCLERASTIKGRERFTMLAGAAACIALGTMSKGPAGALLPASRLQVFFFYAGVCVSYSRQGS